MHPFWISVSFHNPAFPSFPLPCNPGPPLLSTVANGPAAGTGRASVQAERVWASASFMPWESSYAKGKWLLRQELR
ncbi:hypothetical protein PVAP13_2KG362105 [Panicum virgatum]|uniref:Uncharacterized protein n=1 Tax=Panicum virgatum TaxID=38727 RepID=A0A8T0WCF2_PANVG|nr:hypothetical protein PVAP13_2KG362105 [Panicum virgatum]